MGASVSIQSETGKSIVNTYMSIVSNVTNTAVTTAGLEQINISTIKISICPPECRPPGYPVVDCGVGGNLKINQLSNTAFSMTAEQFQSSVVQSATALKSKTVAFVKSKENTPAGEWLEVAFSIQISNNTANGDDQNGK